MTATESGFGQYVIETALSAIRDNTVGDISADESILAKVDNNASKILAAAIAESFRIDTQANIGRAKQSGVFEILTHTQNLNYQQQLYDAINQRLFDTSLSQAKRNIFSQINGRIGESILATHAKIDKLVTDYNIPNIDTNNASAEAIATQLFDQKFATSLFSKLGYLFSGKQAIDLLMKEIDKTSETDLVNHTADWVNVGTSVINTSFVTDGVSLNFLKSIPLMSAKSLAGMLARGVVVGVLTEVSFKGGYEFGKWIFSSKFKDWFGEELYEMQGYQDFFEGVFTTFMGMQSLEEVDITTTLSSLLLMNFKNKDGTVLTDESLATLFGDKDYVHMDFDRVIKVYQQVYKTLTGDDSAESLSTVADIQAHMKAHDVYKLFSGVKGATFTLLEADAQAMIEKASDDASSESMAYRYALQELNPFVITGVDYEKMGKDNINHNKENCLDIYNPKDPETFGGMTSDYIKDRATFLKYYVESKLLNNYSIDETNINSQFTENTRFHDLEQGIKTTVVVKYAGSMQHYTFGSDKAEIKGELDGGSKSDHIFGGGGNDTIKGGKGNDYIEGNKDDDTLDGGADNDTLVGGTGNDTYIFEGKWGKDKIIDSDKDGVIQIDGQNITSPTVKISDTLWKDPAQGLLFHKIENGSKTQLHIISQKSSDSNDSIFITDWQDGGFGIELNKADETPPVWDVSLQPELDYPMHVWPGSHDLSFDITGSRHSDLIMGTGVKNIKVDAGGERDRVYGSLNKDDIAGGDDSDILYGSPNSIYQNDPATFAADADTIKGGSGSDIILGRVGDDLLYADDVDTHKNPVADTEKGDWITGSLGSDQIYGSRSADMLQGGEGTDVIYGGANNDVIIGDGNLELKIKITSLPIIGNKTVSVRYDYRNLRKTQFC